MNIKVLVMAHKKYRMPDDDIYLPIHVGRKGKADIGYTSDHTGDNISALNPRLCELTGIYWAWKNFQTDCIGFVHYRRYFTDVSFFRRFGKDKFNFVLGKREVEKYLSEYDMILPKKRRYYIESMYSHFVHLPYTYEKDIQTLRQIIKEKEPEYVEAFDKVMGRSSAHMFNMYIMKKDIFDRYCSWLFPILLEADQQIDVSSYTPMEARAVAYFGEFMIDVWNERQKIRYLELPVMFMENQNWLIKGGKFLLRKFGWKRNIER